MADKKQEKKADKWKDKLSPEQYNVCRLGATESPFSGKYYRHKENGMYVCIACKTPLFSSETKFESGTGWPSFYDVAKKGNVELNHLHKKHMGNTTNSVDVWIIDGRLVRSGLFIDFVHGGHGYVYDFIPKEEVWLDDDLVQEELPFVLIHELHERNLMKGKSWGYAKAHESASKLEWKLRHNKRGVIKELQKLECSRELVSQLLFGKLV